MVDNRVNSLVALERTLDIQAEVLSLDVGEAGELDVDVVEMETGDLLIEDLGEDVDLLLKLAALGELDVLLGELGVVGLEKHDLSEHLVGEAAGHDKRAVASGTPEVDQTTLGEEDDVAAVLHQEAVDLGLDVLDGLSIGLEPSDVNLDIEVTNV